jgi:stalled ribosome rescue protein Dom34
MSQHPHYHAVVWLDHAEAHVMHFNPEEYEKQLILPAQPHRQLHIKSGPAAGAGKAPEDQKYYHDIARALEDAHEILVVGPANAKLQLIKHIHTHDKDMVAKIIGVETVGHPTDAQVVAYARKYFIAKDRMMFQAAVNL